MMPLAPFRSKAAGLPDLLVYAALIDEGIIQGKDGSLLAGFFFRGKDDASATNAERNFVTAMVNAYLARFGSGWYMWVDAVRISSPGYPGGSHFPDPISALIDAERREMFEQEDKFYETEYALILQYLPPSRKESRIQQLMYDDDSGESIDDRVLSDFKKALADFQSGIGDLLNMRRMGTIRAGVDGVEYDSDELVNYMHFALYAEPVALRIPACPMYLDSWLGMQSLWPGQLLKLGDKFVSCVAIEGFPAKSHPGVLSVLDTLQVSYRWSSRFIFLDQHQAEHGLEKFRRFWNQTVKSFRAQLFRTENGAINLDSLEMTAEVSHALKDAKSGVVGFGYYTSVVVLMSEDKGLLMEQARYVKKEIQRRGFAARVEKENTQEAWLGSLPGHYRPNVRRPLFHTLHLADLLPLSAVWTGLQVNPCPFYPDNSPPLMQAVAAGSTRFAVNLHIGDVGHALVFGPIGAGKSTLLSLIAEQARRYRSRPRPDGSTIPATITAFDKGRSLYVPCSASGGIHYDIGSDDVGGLALCPLAGIDTPSERLWAQEWIETCFELQTGSSLQPEQKSEVARAISLLSNASRNERSLTHFMLKVQDREISAALEHYASDKGMGHLLNGTEDSLRISSFTVFEVDELMKLGDKNAIPVLLYLFRKFERSLTGQPAFLLLDEAWVTLGHPVFREKLRGWLKELRKQNCAVVMATQSLSDAVRSGLLDVLIESCPTKILLPNAEADMYGTKDNPGPADLYKAFGLSDHEIGLLKNAQPKRDYYYTSPLGRQMINLELGPLTLSFVGVSDKDTLREVKAMEDRYGNDWPVYWMRKRGVNYEKYAKPEAKRAA